MKIEEEIECEFCETEFTVTFQDDQEYSAVEYCPFCGEHLANDGYISEGDDSSED